MAKEFCGPENAFNAREVSVPEEVKKLTDLKGADMVLDTVGTPETLQESLECLGARGRLIILGYAYETIFPVSPAKIVYEGRG